MSSLLACWEKRYAPCSRLAAHHPVEITHIWSGDITWLDHLKFVWIVKCSMHCFVIDVKSHLKRIFAVQGYPHFVPLVSLISWNPPYFLFFATPHASLYELQSTNFVSIQIIPQLQTSRLPTQLDKDWTNEPCNHSFLCWKWSFCVQIPTCQKNSVTVMKCR